MLGDCSLNTITLSSAASGPKDSPAESRDQPLTLNHIIFSSNFKLLADAGPAVQFFRQATRPPSSFGYSSTKNSRPLPIPQPIPATARNR